MREPGETVKATQPVFRLVNLDQVYLQFYLHSEQVVRLQVGDLIKVRCFAGGTASETLLADGKVDFIELRGTPPAASFASRC